MQTFRIRTFLLFAFLAFASTAVMAQAEGAAIVARDEPAGGGRAAGTNVREYGSQTSSRTSAKSGKSSKTSGAKTNRSVAVVRQKPKAWDGLVVGDKYTFLNFEVVSAEKPWYTREAKDNGAKGLVQVEVLIDTNGNVIDARARTGNKLLHPEAERAALASKFNRPTFGGKPARAIGFLVYRFGPAED